MPDPYHGSKIRAEVARLISAEQLEAAGEKICPDTTTVVGEFQLVVPELPPVLRVDEIRAEGKLRDAIAASHVVPLFNAAIDAAARQGRSFTRVRIPQAMLEDFAPKSLSDFARILGGIRDRGRAQYDRPIINAGGYCIYVDGDADDPDVLYFLFDLCSESAFSVNVVCGVGLTVCFRFWVTIR